MNKQIDTSHLEGLVTFLAVARLGHYVSAAQFLGVNHTTVSRRINDLEKTLGGPLLVRSKNGWELTGLGEKSMRLAEEAEGLLRELRDLKMGGSGVGLSGLVRIAAPDAFSVYVATPAMASLRREHPEMEVELISATQRARQRRSGMDVEIVVGRPQVINAITKKVMDYNLRLYASRDYLHRCDSLHAVEDIQNHPLIYYVESGLHVDDLDSGRKALPLDGDAVKGISCTSVFGHISATLHGAGVGLLPDYVARYFDLEPVLEQDFKHPVSYWAVIRKENARNLRVRACVQAILSRAGQVRLL